MISSPPIDPRWFAGQDTVGMARRLLGQLLVHDTADGLAAGMIVETEAYQGPLDQAAHSFGNRRTRRTEVMFGPPGHAYLYQIYGRYVCFDVVSGPVGAPEAVLVRAIAPVENLPLMTRRRGVGAESAIGSGPGKLTQALGITMAENGLPLWQPPLYLAHYRDPWPSQAIAAGPRRNIPYAGDAQGYPWRFWIRGHPSVSRPSGATAES